MSYLDFHTLRRSAGLPELFLRGCGLPNSITDFAGSLAGFPKQFSSCFIIYSSNDDEFASRLHRDLVQSGIVSFMAPGDMRVGDPWAARVYQGITTSNKAVVVLSRHSTSSTWIRSAVEVAVVEKVRRNQSHDVKPPMILPLKIDKTVTENTPDWMTSILRSREAADFRNWRDHHSYQASFARLLRALSVTDRPPRTIVSTSDVLGGEPRYQGTRIALRHITGRLEAGASIPEILRDYPALSYKDVELALIDETGASAQQVAHLGRAGMSDLSVWEYAFANDQVMIIMNVKDFLHLAADSEIHPGLIAIHAGQLSAYGQWAVLEPAIDFCLSDGAGGRSLVNRIVEVSYDGTRRCYSLPA